MDDKAEVLELDDAAQLAVIASPVRFIAFEELFASQVPMTATQLARRTRVSPSSMSYHLRELQRVGLVRRATPGGDGRERLWEAPALRYDIRLSAVDDPAGRLALVDAYLSPLRARIAATLERRSGTGAERDGEHALGMGRLRLTREEMVALQAEVAAVWHRYEDVGWRRDQAGADLVTAHYVWSLLSDEQQP
ncbi:Helix-turn-helix domain-containing protein [Klenkia marina]|uniref:Helix-turn-helix domain-containing protein n=1 Tax=Klenkia marina TaxID=1960309 RepID=A0A1G4XU97_9ACTN|nr:helix-turn-helix domain-containing protein [Klenkia marina]SCX44685.1 Helix-turn-helix domain-containing protein [Klenkia marina]